MADVEKPTAALRRTVEDKFFDHFGRPAEVVVAAPGRVNLIGEHIDYNDGFVLPLALDRYVLMAAAVGDPGSPQPVIRLHSKELGTTESIHLDADLASQCDGWTSYIAGVIAGFNELGLSVPGFDAVIGSTVPVGGGLSSSAALEVAFATLLEQLTGHTLSKVDKALLCQRAEHCYAGVPCGIMDQFSSVFGKENQLMLLDCRSQKIESVPFDATDVSILVTNSNVRHELTGGEYAARRAECDAAIAVLDALSWRDATLEEVIRVRDLLTEPQFRRARHVVSEIDRTVEAADAFGHADWHRAGQKMYASHQSLRDDFDVSCMELDLLVDIANGIGVDGGVYGSRMTGGGFGGCTVSLVANEQLAAVTTKIASEYERRTGVQPHCFATRPSRGAHVLTG